jgi:hypothetical protein
VFSIHDLANQSVAWAFHIRLRCLGDSCYVSLHIRKISTIFLQVSFTEEEEFVSDVHCERKVLFQVLGITSYFSEDNQNFRDILCVLTWKMETVWPSNVYKVTPRNTPRSNPKYRTRFFVKRVCFI